MDAIILAGGKGTRLAPYSTVFPKPLVPLGNKPIIDIIIQQLDYYGFDRIIISLGYLGELIEAYYNATIKGRVRANIEFVRESEPLGTVGALSLVKNLTDPFIVINGDTLTTLNYKNLMEFHRVNQGLITVASNKKKVKIDSGVINLNSNMQIEKITEKPTMDYLVSIGVNVFQPEVLKYIPTGKRLDFPDLIQQLLQENQKIVGFVSEDYWLDLGTHADYGKAQEEFEVMKSKLLPGVYE
ncbi:Nucleotidyl transferase [Propionispora vibrioides]|uniref:Nucleotidyl transferase n=2 Tax=Propionispora vibrioides TaxID=112903 RepID=A0A1H8RY08_9FIRM|nr:Nucleotidyl transferase [Propionispora vibrioides]